jgi:exonuclease VII small subunit
VALLQRLTALEGQSLDSLAERVASLRDEQSALETVAAELERFAPTSEAAAQKLDEYRQRIVQIGDELPQYAEALKAATREALSEAADTYREALGEAEAKRADALKAAEAKRDDALKELDDERADQRVEAERKALSVETDFNQAVEAAREAHRRRLQAIDDQFDKDSELAASELNAAGVAAAIERRNAERATADETLSDAEQSAVERRDTERAALAQELSDFAAAQEERRAVIFAAAAEERAAAQANYSASLVEAQAAYDAQRQAAISAQALALQDLRAAGDAERQVRRAALDQFASDSLTALQTLVESGRNVLASLIASAGVPAQPSFATAASTSTLGILPNTGSRSVAATINVNGATDPEEVAEQVRRTMIRVAQGF